MTERICKDCFPDPEARAAARALGAAFVDGRKIPVRPATYKGPRCYTHHHEEKKRVKAARHEKRTQKVYALPDGDYDRLYAFQGGRCALCRVATGASRKLSVDHDHACCPGSTSCGECVRGLLCRPCNSLLGHARDKIAFFRRCIRYLGVPPYSAMREGWEEWYKDE